jgi:nucleotide-binding universal stress UspA family protein
MLRTILIGLDGSAYSTRAVELGLRWARQADALLVGLGVIDEPTIRRPEPVPLGAGAFKQHRDDRRVAEARRQAEQFLEQFALRCAEAKVACKVLEDVGLPHEQIVREAQRYDLILLGRQTYFHFETQVGADDTLSRVLRNSPRPVVTVPERLPEGRSMLVAYDGSLQAAHALYAFQASGLAGAEEVHVVSVAADRREAAGHAERAADFLRSHDVRARAQPVATGDEPSVVLREQAARVDASLVVLGAYGKPTWREFFLGSVTRALLRDASVPLFLYH